MDQVHITLPCKIKRVVRFARQTSAACSQVLVAKGTTKILNYERMHKQNCTARRSLFQWLSRWERGSVIRLPRCHLETRLTQGPAVRPDESSNESVFLLKCRCLAGAADLARDSLAGKFDSVTSFLSMSELAVTPTNPQLQGCIRTVG
jgi:hypothetical protein